MGSSNIMIRAKTARSLPYISQVLDMLIIMSFEDILNLN